ncbi:hypothetical protein LXH13_06215 [Streptomyces spinosirectus]|jgi:hypothetical protein|uniref:hypothetical protein n=1 Tax=Streptomyces TaxID=1883 RepID=UPI001C9E1830|nr:MULTISPECIES: hypothetical protein [Streptomyces]MBY8341998.1 hypothetical protein [Streptomyces plumbidurans]UIR16653.1 hypothetical protein LXH13_06215 [Streptomyces spinosirectus]
MRWPWQPKPAPQPRADRTRIAELEYELFGIEPEPNTAAAFAIGLRRAFNPDLGGPLPGYDGGTDLSRIPMQPMTMNRTVPAAPQP